MLGKIKQFHEAEKHFKIAISILNDATYHSNLGVLYHRWNRLDDAEKAYIAALELNPELNSAKENLKLLMKSKRK